MSARRAKQIIYGALYCLILFAILAGIYDLFVKPAVTPAACTGPSCGSAAAQPLATSTVWTFTAGSGSATYLAKVADTNAGFGAVAFDYAFDFYNASGTIIESIPGSSFIYPNQVKYLLAPNYTPVTASYRSLDVSNVQWVTSSSMGALPQFAFTNLQAQTGPATVSVSGQMTNDDVASFSAVFVIAVFKDANGNPLGASQTEIDRVAPNAAENFSVIYPAVPGINPANNELEAYGLRTGM